MHYELVSCNLSKIKYLRKKKNWHANLLEQPSRKSVPMMPKETARLGFRTELVCFFVKACESADKDIQH